MVCIKMDKFLIWPKVSVVTGNPNRGRCTVLETIMLNYNKRGDNNSMVMNLQLIYGCLFSEMLQYGMQASENVFKEEIYKSRGTPWIH